MDIPPKTGKGKRKRTGPYADSKRTPPRGRAQERILQHRKARGLDDQLDATGEFSESVATEEDAGQPDEGKEQPTAAKTRKKPTQSTETNDSGETSS